MTFHGIDGIAPVGNLTSAAWIPAALWSWRDGADVGTRAGAVVPPVFEAYVRVFHPAGPLNAAAEDRVPSRWADVAAWSGRVVHPAMQWGGIATTPDGRTWPGEAPWEGSLHVPGVDALVPLLQAATSTPDRLLLAVWDGYGLWHPGARTFLYAVTPGIRGRLAVWRRRREHRKTRRQPSAIEGLPLLATEGREYVVFNGGFAAVRAMTGRVWRQSPNLWWPEDREWCVASEIDFDTTLIGGSRRLIDQIGASPELEPLEISPEVRLDYLGDQVNDPDGSLSRRISGIE